MGPVMCCCILVAPLGWAVARHCAALALGGSGAEKGGPLSAANMVRLQHVHSIKLTKFTGRKADLAMAEVCKKEAARHPG